MLGEAFQFMEYNDHDPVAYAHCQAASVFLEHPTDITIYHRILARLDDLALSADRSRALLTYLANTSDRAPVRPEPKRTSTPTTVGTPSG